MRYRCPVCFFDKLPYPPADYHICPCCGTEFGNDDADYSHEQLREMWIAGGANWFFGRSPEHWNPWLQLIQAGHEYAVPFKIKVGIRQPLGAERWVNIIRGTHEIPRVVYV
jgi:hypothetical protein